VLNEKEKTLLEVCRTEILNSFLSKLISPSLYSLDSFWAKDASIEVLETDLMCASRALQMSLTPKAHACETHACAQMELEGSMGDYDEDFVERWHQKG
jgi:hypothetical protein